MTLTVPIHYARLFTWTFLLGLQYIQQRNRNVQLSSSQNNNLKRLNTLKLLFLG